MAELQCSYGVSFVSLKFAFLFWLSVFELVEKIDFASEAIVIITETIL